MTSPVPTTTSDAPVSPRVALRSRKRWSLLVGLTVIVGIAFATSACTPQVVAKQAIQKHWGTRLAPCAEKVVQRESGYKADAVNSSSGATGLFQLMPSHAKWIKATFGYDFSEMKDPSKNARVARALSNEAYRYWGDGWQPWRLSGRAIRNGGCPA